MPAGVVQNGVDMAERDPQLAHSQFLRRIEDEDPAFGQAFADRLPIHFDKTPCDEYRRTRDIGEDNVAVLSDWLGMSEDEVKQAEELEHLK